MKAVRRARPPLAKSAKGKSYENDISYLVHCGGFTDDDERPSADPAVRPKLVHELDAERRKTMKTMSLAILIGIAASPSWSRPVITTAIQDSTDHQG